MRGGCLALTTFVLVALVGVGAMLAGLVGEVLLGDELPRVIGLYGTTAVFALLFAVSARRLSSRRGRAMFRTWLYALPFPIVLLPATLREPSESQVAAMLQVALAAVYVAAMHLLLRKARPQQLVWGGPTALGAALGIALAWSWFAWGALGSLLDALLALAAGLLFGWTASLLICRVWLRALRLEPQAALGQKRRDTLTGGLVIGLTLFIMARGFGLGGQALLLVAALSLLGWLAMAVARLGTDEATPPEANQPAVALLIGLVAAAALAFSDHEPLAPRPLLGDFNPLWHGLRAAAATAELGLLLAAVLGLRLGLVGRGWSGDLARPRIGVAALVLAAAVAVLVYGTAGQPGLYGDRLFVILKDQADVSAASSMPDYDARRRWVYQTLTSHAESSQASLRRDLDAAGIPFTPYYLENALEVAGDQPLRLWLEARPEVDRVVPSPRLRPLSQPPETAEGSEEAPGEPPWGLQRIGAPRVWSELGVRGAGVVVGQSDSGVQWDHPELRAAYRGTAAGGSAIHAGNWLDPWEGRPEPYDRGGHGTHTLGTVLGQTVGVAPGATWFACANLVRDVGNAALYLDCMQFMLAPYPAGGDPFRDGDPTRAAHVTNNSWGCPRDLEGCDPNSLLDAARALRAAGIFVVASAGNEGPGCSTIADPLALYDDVFSIGAIGPNGSITRFSSVGPVTVDGSNRLKPDLVAPGADVISAFPRGTYEQADGTSMAGPHVVGVVALLWSANPALVGDVERTEDILRRSAAPYAPGSAPPDVADDAIPPDSSGDNADDEALLPAPQGVCTDQVPADTLPNPIVGYGVVDAYRAVKLALEP